MLFNSDWRYEMKNTFKKGDRVKCYGGAKFHSSTFFVGAIGTVEYVADNNWGICEIFVKLKSEKLLTFHPRQLRKLKARAGQ